MNWIWYVIELLKISNYERLWKLVFYVRCLKIKVAISLKIHVKHRLIITSTRNRNSRFDTVTTCSQKTKNDRVLVILTTTKSYESFIKCIQTFIIDSHYLICAISEILTKKHEKSIKYRQFDRFFQESFNFLIMQTCLNSLILSLQCETCL